MHPATPMPWYIEAMAALLQAATVSMNTCLPLLGDIASAGHTPVAISGADDEAINDSPLLGLVESSPEGKNVMSPIF